MNKLRPVPGTSVRPAARPPIQLARAALSHVRGGADDDPDTTHKTSKPAAKRY